MYVFPFSRRRSSFGKFGIERANKICTHLSRDSGKASSSTIILQDFHILIYTMVPVDDGYIPRSTLYISKAKIVSLRELQLINFQLIMSLEMLDHGSD